jgi:F-type H+-transporting ATPase subunit delta
MAADKKTKLLAKQLFKLSLRQRPGVARAGRRRPRLDREALPAPPALPAQAYHRSIATELAKSRALVEHAGPIGEATLRQIEAAMTKKYSRPVTASARPNPALLAGLRVRVGSDLYESSVPASSPPFPPQSNPARL